MNPEIPTATVCQIVVAQRCAVVVVAVVMLAAIMFVVVTQMLVVATIAAVAIPVVMMFAVTHVKFAAMVSVARTAFVVRMLNAVLRINFVVVRTVVPQGLKNAVILVAPVGALNSVKQIMIMGQHVAHHMIFLVKLATKVGVMIAATIPRQFILVIP